MRDIFIMFLIFALIIIGIYGVAIGFCSCDNGRETF